MTSVELDEITLQLNLDALDARLAVLTDSPILRDKLEKARASMVERLDRIRFPVVDYDPSQEPDDDDDV